MLIPLMILVPPGNPSVSHQTNDSNNNIDKIVHKITAGKNKIESPPSERNKNDRYSKKLKQSFNQEKSADK